MKNYNLMTLFIACALIFAGESVSRGLKSIAAKDRVVAVKGLDTRDVQADYVVWPMSYSISGNDLTMLQNDVKRINGKITKFLISKGFHAEDIHEGNSSIYNQWDNYYGERRPTYQYQMSTTLVLQTADVERVVENRQCMSELVSQGIIINTSNWDMDYQYNGLTEIKPTMIEQATKNARAVAEKFAEDANCKLGSIASASQGQFSIESDSYQPWIKHIRVVTTVNYYLK